MKTLIIINDPPYGTEKAYNALRLAHALVKNDGDAEMTVFLMADAVTAARQGQKTPDGYYNLERMLHRVLAGDGRVLLCGTCMDARGLTENKCALGSRGRCGALWQRPPVSSCGRAAVAPPSSGLTISSPAKPGRRFSIAEEAGRPFARL